MPEIKNHKSLDGDLKLFKRMTKNMKQTYESDRGLGATVPVAEAVDVLLKSCEEIETSAELLLYTIDRGQFTENQKEIGGIRAFYEAVRRGIGAVRSLQFGTIPKTDVAALTQYLESLKAYYTTFMERYADIANLEEDPADVQSQQMNVASDLAQGPQILSDLENGLASIMDRIAAINFDPLIEIEAEIDTTNTEMGKADQAIRDLEQVYKNQPGRQRGQGLTAIQYSQQRKRIKDIFDALLVQLEALHREADKYKKLKTDFKKLKSAKEQYESEIAKVKSKIGMAQQRQGPLGLQYEKSRKHAGIVNLDRKKILSTFKTFIDTLEDGLMRYNAGLTGFVNKIGNIEKTRQAIGGSIPKRYL